MDNLPISLFIVERVPPDYINSRIQNELPPWSETELGREINAACEQRGQFDWYQTSRPAEYNSFNSLDRHRLRAFVSIIVCKASTNT